MTGALHTCGVCGDCACYIRGRLSLCSTCADHVLPFLFGSGRTSYAPATTTNVAAPEMPMRSAQRWRS